MWISWIPGSGVGRCVAGCGSILGPSLDPIVSLQDQILRSFVSSMNGDPTTRCIEHVSVASLWLAARTAIFIDFHELDGPGVLGLALYGGHRP